MEMTSILNRIALAKRYAALSHRLRDRPALAIAGLAKYRSFSGTDVLSKSCRTLFPLLRVRPDRFGNLAVFLNPLDASHIEIFDEVVIERVYDLSLVTFNPAAIVDCGGHIGLFSAQAAATFPGVPLTIFEPLPANVAMLKRLVAENRIPAAVRQEAVSDKDRTARFYERQSFGGSLTNDNWKQEIVGSYEVQVVDLISFFETNRPERLLLKMDIEGEEESLLPKSIPYLPAQTAIFFETHTASQGWDVVTSELRNSGFSTRLLRSRDPFRDGFALRTK